MLQVVREMVTQKKQIKEPSVVIKPIGPAGGLDYIHLALAALVGLLVLIILIISYGKTPMIQPLQANSSALAGNSPRLNCTYGYLNGKCIAPESNASQIKSSAERFLASYNYINSSLSLLPYISNVTGMKENYIPYADEWYVSVPAKNPVSNATFTFAMLVNDTDNSKIVPLIQTVAPAKTGSNYVVASGVVQIAGQPECRISSPLQAYWFVDPYASGSMLSFSDMLALDKEYGNRINSTVKILYTQASQRISSEHGTNDTLALGSYLFCASAQPEFGNFLRRLSQNYTGAYVSGYSLYEMALGSGINMSAMGNCLSTASEAISRQGLLAQYYNITSSPSVVTDCRYLSIPQTENKTIRYANSSIV